jgi:hypothetical protein
MNIKSLEVRPRQNGPYNNYAKARIYIFLEGETIRQNLESRRCRPVTFYKQAVLPELLNRVPELQGHKLKWSQKAGCRCGCSPGFIVENSSSYDVFVTIE